MNEIKTEDGDTSKRAWTSPIMEELDFEVTESSYVAGPGPADLAIYSV